MREPRQAASFRVAIVIQPPGNRLINQSAGLAGCQALFSELFQSRLTMSDTCLAGGLVSYSSYGSVFGPADGRHWAAGAARTTEWHAASARAYAGISTVVRGPAASD